MPGAALHAEITAFEEAGLTRERTWRLASRDAARVLGVFDTGHLAVGQQADLLVSPNSPYRPAWEPRTISATICGGACMLATDLDGAIHRELARFESRVGDHLSRWLTRITLGRTARRFVG